MRGLAVCLGFVIIITVTTLNMEGLFINEENQKLIIKNQELIIAKQDSIIEINQAFRRHHLDHCAFKEIDR